MYYNNIYSKFRGCYNCHPNSLILCHLYFNNAFIFIFITCPSLINTSTHTVYICICPFLIDHFLTGPIYTGHIFIDNFLNNSLLIDHFDFILTSMFSFTFLFILINIFLNFNYNINWKICWPKFKRKWIELLILFKKQVGKNDYFYKSIII